MFLDHLKVCTSKEIIREVKFKSGLNLIIDETTDHTKDSGNNVGKTTFLRVIDFCLGGDKDNIYTDKEFKKKNKTLYDFLIQNKVYFELDLKSSSGTKHQIIRPIDGESSIDGAEYSDDKKFDEALQKLLFGYAGGRPTLAQLMNKFIRIEDYQISNALKFLFTMADDSQYEALYMFLFGFRNNELFGKKRKLVDKIKKLNKLVKSSDYKVEDLEQQLYLIDKEIEDLSNSKNSFQFSHSVDQDLSSLKNLQSTISDLKSSISKINLRLALSNDSLKQLQNSKSSLSVKAIQKLYNHANIEIPGLKKKFQDVLTFHNNMVDNKINYLNETIHKINSTLRDLQRNLETKLSEETKIVETISKYGALGEYDKINAKLQERSRDKGVKEGIIDVLKKQNSELSDAQKQLSIINDTIKEFDESFKSNLKKFNIYFSSFSERLYGDQYYLSPKKHNNGTTDNYLLEIGNLKENIGTGKKKAQISALDLAYLKYSEESQDELPLFVLHDQLETVFENQIETLFELANSIRGQFIVAVLSDKLHNMSPEEINKNCILKLSQSNKFFKV